jgi:hypothetical protein
VYLYVEKEKESPVKTISKFSIVLTLLLGGTLLMTGIAFSGQNVQSNDPSALPTQSFWFNIFTVRAKVAYKTILVRFVYSQVARVEVPCNLVR